MAALDNVVFWVNEWLSFNNKWAIFKLYHGENKLQFNEIMMFALYETNTRVGCL